VVTAPNYPCHHGPVTKGSEQAKAAPLWSGFTAWNGRWLDLIHHKLGEEWAGDPLQRL